jgi:thioredoxin 1
MKAITELNDRNFDMTVNSATTPVVVDFYAPWCGPCKMLAPLLDSLAEHFAGRIQFYKVNVDEAPELAGRFQVTGVPMLGFFAQGELRDVVLGFPQPPVLAAKLNALIAGSPAEVRV